MRREREGKARESMGREGWPPVGESGSANARINFILPETRV